MFNIIGNFRKVKELESKIAGLESWLEFNSDQEERLNAMWGALLEDERADFKTKMEIQTKYNERLSAENAQLSRELLKMRTDCENEIRKCETRYEKVIDEYHERCVKAEGKNKSLNDGLDYWIKKTKQLEVATNSALERWKAEKVKLEQQKNDLRGHNTVLKKKIERLDIENRLKKEVLIESEKERVDLRNWNQKSKEEIRVLKEKEKEQEAKIDELLERITFYEEVEEGNVCQYQEIINKQNEQIKRLEKGMSKRKKKRKKK